MALDTLTILAQAVRELQKEVAWLKKKAAEPRIVYSGTVGLSGDLLPDMPGRNIGSIDKPWHGLFLRDVAPGFETVIDMSWGNTLADRIQIIGGGGVGDPRMSLILGNTTALHLRPTYVQLGGNVNLLAGVNSEFGSVTRPWTKGYVEALYATNSIYTENLLSTLFGVIDVFDHLRMATDQMIQLSNETTAPAPSSTKRGKLRLVHGGEGDRDRLYNCLKGDAGGYTWVQITDGGA